MSSARSSRGSTPPAARCAAASARSTSTPSAPASASCRRTSSPARSASRTLRRAARPAGRRRDERGRTSLDGVWVVGRRRGHRRGAARAGGRPARRPRRRTEPGSRGPATSADERSARRLRARSRRFQRGLDRLSPRRGWSTSWRHRKPWCAAARSVTLAAVEASLADGAARDRRRQAASRGPGWAAARAATAPASSRSILARRTGAARARRTGSRRRPRSSRSPWRAPLRQPRRRKRSEIDVDLLAEGEARGDPARQRAAREPEVREECDHEPGQAARRSPAVRRGGPGRRPARCGAASCRRPRARPRSRSGDSRRARRTRSGAALCGRRPGPATAADQERPAARLLEREPPAGEVDEVLDERRRRLGAETSAASARPRTACPRAPRRRRPRHRRSRRPGCSRAGRRSSGRGSRRFAARARAPPSSEASSPRARRPRGRARAPRGAGWRCPRAGRAARRPSASETYGAMRASAARSSSSTSTPNPALDRRPCARGRAAAPRRRRRSTRRRRSPRGRPRAPARAPARSGSRRASARGWARTPCAHCSPLSRNGSCWICAVQAARVAAGGLRVQIVTLDERHLRSGLREVIRGRGARDPASDHDDVLFASGHGPN